MQLGKVGELRDMASEMQILAKKGAYCEVEKKCEFWLFDIFKTSCPFSKIFDFGNKQYLYFFSDHFLGLGFCLNMIFYLILQFGVFSNTLILAYWPRKSMQTRWI